MNNQEEQPGFLGNKFTAQCAQPPANGWQRLQAELAPAQPKRRPAATWWQAAAVIALLLTASLTLWHPWNLPTGELAQNETDNGQKQSLPTGETAPLPVGEGLGVGPVEVANSKQQPTTQMSKSNSLPAGEVQGKVAVNEQIAITETSTNPQQTPNASPIKGQRNTNENVSQPIGNEEEVKVAANGPTATVAVATKANSGRLQHTIAELTSGRVATAVNSRGLQPTERAENTRRAAAKRPSKTQLAATPNANQTPTNSQPNTSQIASQPSGSEENNNKTIAIANSRVATAYNSRGLQPTVSNESKSSRLATASSSPTIGRMPLSDPINIRIPQIDTILTHGQPNQLLTYISCACCSDEVVIIRRFHLAISPRLTWQQSLYQVQTATESGTQKVTASRTDMPGIELALRGGLALRPWLSTGVEVGLNRFSSQYKTELTDFNASNALTTNRTSLNTYDIVPNSANLAPPAEQTQTDVRTQLNTQVFIGVHPRHGGYGVEAAAGFSTGLYQGITTTANGVSNTLRQPSGQVQPMGQALAYLRLWQHRNTRLRIEGGLRLAPDRYQQAGEGVSVHRRQAFAGVQLQF